MTVDIASEADSWALRRDPQALSRCLPRSVFSRAERGTKGAAFGLRELLDTDQLELDEWSDCQEGMEDCQDGMEEAVDGRGGESRNSIGVWKVGEEGERSMLVEESSE